MSDFDVTVHPTAGWTDLSQGSVHLLCQSEDDGLLAELREAVGSGDADEVLDALASRGVRRAPEFVLVHAGVTPGRVAVRGSGYAAVSGPAGAESLRAAARGPWSDEDLAADVTAVALHTGAGPAEADADAAGSGEAGAGDDSAAEPLFSPSGWRRPSVFMASAPPERVTRPFSSGPPAGRHVPEMSSLALDAARERAREAGSAGSAQTAAGTASGGGGAPTAAGGAAPTGGGAGAGAPTGLAARLGGAMGAVGAGSVAAQADSQEAPAAQPDESPEPDDSEPDERETTPDDPAGEQDEPAVSGDVGLAEAELAALWGPTPESAEAPEAVPTADLVGTDSHAGAEGEDHGPMGPAPIEAAGGFDGSGIEEGDLTLAPPEETQTAPAEREPLHPAPQEPAPSEVPQAPLADAHPAPQHTPIDSVPWRRDPGQDTPPPSAPPITPPVTGVPAAPPVTGMPDAPPAPADPPVAFPPAAAQPPRGLDRRDVPEAVGDVPEPAPQAGTPMPPAAPAAYPPVGEPAPPVSEPAQPASEPATPVGEPAPPVSEPAPRVSEPAPATTHMGGEATWPIILAVLCPAGHTSPPHAGVCRACGREIPPQMPFETHRPALGVLRLSTGDVVTLDRGVLLGRSPKVNSNLAPADRPHLLRVPSPENDISRNHCEVVLEGWHVLVRDLGSTNGTTVALPGELPVRMRASDQQALEPGTVVTMAEEVSFTFEVGA
ncbi:MAG: FHA domain-containing protein [Micrococcales bacterium]|nr:FHA domain-containing protein [Micrococcales bacterium]